MKTLVLVDGLVLFGAGLAVAGLRKGSMGWQQFIVTRGLKQGIAVSVLMALELTAVELGAGGFAAAFATLTVLGYLMTVAGVLGPGLLAIENSIFGQTVPTGNVQ